MKTEEVTFEMKDARTKDIRMYCFVCTGNTCRSPMAAAVLNHYGNAHGIFAFSRGISAQSGASISQNAVKALQNAGIESAGRNDYARHRALQFEKADFEHCDGIFAISPAHAEALILAFPEYAAKVRTLGNIADPFGGSLADYEKCLSDIAAALRGVFPYLFDGNDGNDEKH